MELVVWCNDSKIVHTGSWNLMSEDARECAQQLDDIQNSISAGCLSACGRLYSDHQDYTAKLRKTAHPSQILSVWFFANYFQQKQWCNLFFVANFYTWKLFIWEKRRWFQPFHAFCLNFRYKTVSFQTILSHCIQCEIMPRAIQQPAYFITDRPQRLYKTSLWMNGKRSIHKRSHNITS